MSLRLKLCSNRSVWSTGQLNIKGSEKCGRHAAHGMGLPARELARIAYCMLEQGRWKAKGETVALVVDRIEAAVVVDRIFTPYVVRGQPVPALRVGPRPLLARVGLLRHRRFLSCPRALSGWVGWWSVEASLS